MSLTIKLLSPDVSEEYTEWVNKSTAFDREYYQYNAPDKYKELYRGDTYYNRNSLEKYGLPLLRDGFTTAKEMLAYLLERTPLINPEEESLIDFCCGLIAACIKFPNATVETY